MKLGEKHLIEAEKEFEVVRKFRHNVLDHASQYYENGIGNLVLRYTCNLFDSYDLMIGNKEKIEYEWDEFYKLLKDNLGIDYEGLFSKLIDRYSIAYNF
jgi:hypothetical protein